MIPQDRRVGLFGLGRRGGCGPTGGFLLGPSFFHAGVPQILHLSNLSPYGTSFVGQKFVWEAASFHSAKWDRQMSLEVSPLGNTPR